MGDWFYQFRWRDQPRIGSPTATAADECPVWFVLVDGGDDRVAVGGVERRRLVDGLGHGAGGDRRAGDRVDLAAAFRWTARLNMHEAVANHFSLSINEDGTRFLMNPNQMHFSRIRASDLIEVRLDSRVGV